MSLDLLSEEEPLQARCRQFLTLYPSPPDRWLFAGLSFLYSVSMGEPLKVSAISCGNMSGDSLTQPSWRKTAEILFSSLRFNGLYKFQ